MAKNEERFFAAFTDRINVELDKCYHPKAADQTDYIATGENMVALAQAGVFFFGIASAPFTFGLGLAAAGATIVLIKAGKFCLDQYLDGKTPPQELPPDYLDNQRDLQRLALYILLRQVAIEVSMRYRHSIENRLDEENVQKFGQYIAQRVMKKLYADLIKDPHQLPSVESLVDYFLSSIQHSGLLHTEELTIKPTEGASPLRRAAISRKIATKQFCARQRILVYNETEVTVFGAESNPFQDQFHTTTTREDLGYITLFKDKLSSLDLAINTDILHEITIETAKLQTLTKESTFPHFVTPQEIEDYQKVYQNTKISLNEYLSQKYQRPTIAHCNNDALKGLAFLGDYSYVNFYNADLSECDFSNADFNHANLALAKMFCIKTSPQTNFQNIYAEGSVWMGKVDNKLILHADISHAKLQGSTWVKCEISNLAKQMGSEWALAVLDKETVIVDVNQQSFEKRLQEEHDARLEYSKRVEALETRCKSIENLAKTQTQTTTAEIEQLRQEFSSLQQAQVGLERSINHRLDCIDEQLTNLTNATATNTTAITHLEGRLEQVVAKQNIRDSGQDARIDELAARQSEMAAEQDVYINLQQYCVTEVFTDDYRTKKETYIPLYIKHPRAAVDIQPMVLSDYIYSIVNQHQHKIAEPLFILIGGETGCGKTFEVTRFIEAINALHGDEHRWAGIPIDTSTITEKGSNVCNSGLDKVTNRCPRTKLTQNPCIIHLSKLDISNITIEKIFRDCTDTAKIWTAPLVFILTARDRYIEQARPQLDRFLQEKPQNLLECTIQPLTDDQIHEFFRLFPKQQLSSLWNSYHQQEILNIASLGRTPLVLAIMTGVLVEFNKSKGTDKPMHKTDFYRASWRALFDRIRHKLPEQYQSYDKFMQEMYNLAKAMLRSRLDAVEFTVKDLNPSQKKDALHELLETKMGALSPLSITKKDNNNYVVRFIHPSLGYFLIAEILIENLFKPDFPNKDTQTLWGKNYLLKMPEILDCLVELLQQYPETEVHTYPTIKMVKQNSFDAFEVLSVMDDDDSDDETPIKRDKTFIQERLLDLVRTTHVSVPKRLDNKKQASNALTLLCRWRRNLAGVDFSKLILHHVDGTNGWLPYAIFEESDLSGGCYYNAMLFRAILRKTILEQTRFLNANRFLEMGSVAKTFLVYRSNSENDIILAYPLPPTDKNSKYQIAIVKITGEQVELLRRWPVHDQEITAMDISMHSTEIRFASVGLGSTVRVALLPSTGQPVEIAKLHNFKHREPVDHIVFGPDANWVATGARDGFVRIWDIGKQNRTYKSSSFQAEITGLVCGKRSQTLFAIGGNTLFSFDISNNFVAENIPLRSNTGGKFTSLALASHETHLAIGTSQGNIIILALASKTVTQTLKGHKNSVSSLVWYQDLISSSYDHTIRIWPSDANEGSVFQHDHPIGKVDMLPNGHIVSGIGHESTRLYFWDPKQNTNSNLSVKNIGLISCIAANPTAEHIAIGDVKGTVLIYPLQDMEQPDAPVPQPVMMHMQASVQSLAWSSNGQYLASIGQDQNIYIKEYNTDALPITIPTKPNVWLMHLVWCLEDDTHQLIIGYSDGSLGLYQSIDEFQTQRSIVPYSPPAAITWLAARTSSPQLAIASGHQVLLCSPKSSSADLIVTHPNNPPKMLVWSPNGLFLVSCDDSSGLYIWNVLGLSMTLVAQYQAAEIKTIIWANEWLILGNSKEILYWKINSGTEIKDIPPSHIPLKTKLLTHTLSGDVVIARSTGIYRFSQQDLNPGQQQPDYKWQFQRIKAGFCADESDITDITGASSSTESYLGKNGAITKVVTSSSFLNYFSNGLFSRSSDLENNSAELPELLPAGHNLRFFASIQPKQPLVVQANAEMLQHN